MSGILDRLNRKHAEELAMTRYLTRVECADKARIVLNLKFGFGPVQNARFMEGLEELDNYLANLSDEDTKDHQYTIAKFEELLKQADKDNYRSREERCKY